MTGTTIFEIPVTMARRPRKTRTGLGNPNPSFHADPWLALRMVINYHVPILDVAQCVEPKRFSIARISLDAYLGTEKKESTTPPSRLALIGFEPTPLRLDW